MTPRIKVIIEKTNTGYSAYAPDEQGIAMTTAGKTFEEIKENFLEVVEMSVEYYQEKQQWEDAERLQNAKLDFYIDVEQFFEYFYMINKTAFARFIGLNESQMRKWSKGIVPISDKKALQIQKGLHNLADDLKAVHFV